MENDPGDDKLNSLFAEASKAAFYDTALENGFETRLIARVRETRGDHMSFLLWAWRLIPVFLSVIIFLGVWYYLSKPNQGIDLSALAGTGTEENMLVAYLTGR